MTNTTRIIAAVLLAATAVIAPKLQSVEWGKLLQNGEAAPSVVQVDQAALYQQMRLDLASMLPDLETVDDTNDLVKLVNDQIRAGFRDEKVTPETAQAMGEVDKQIFAALGIVEGGESKSVTQAERVTVANILNPPVKP